MAIIQTPQVGNQSAYPKILPLSNILMVLINQHKLEEGEFLDRHFDYQLEGFE